MKTLRSIWKPAIIAVIALNLNTIQLKAQNDEIQLVQNIYGMQKRDIVNNAVKLSPEEAQKFWTIYDDYEMKRKKLGAERIQIISEYVKAYPDLTKEQADRLAKSALKNDIAFDKLHKKYYNKMKAKIGPLKAASFFQLETYLQNAIKYSIQEQLPFIGELEKIKKK